MIKEPNISLSNDTKQIQKNYKYAATPPSISLIHISSNKNQKERAQTLTIFLVRKQARQSPAPCQQNEAIGSKARAHANCCALALIRFRPLNQTWDSIRFIPALFGCYPGPAASQNSRTNRIWLLWSGWAFDRQAPNNPRF